jgi:HTH-type transcriptional regulator/antitoxin HigA
MMDATLIVVDSDAELVRALKSLESMMGAHDPVTVAQAAAQARLIEAYEESKWPRPTPRVADTIRYLMDQHGLTRADMIPILGSASRVSEVLSGKKGLSMRMVQRLRARFGVPADVLLPPPKAMKRKAA